MRDHQQLQNRDPFTGGKMNKHTVLQLGLGNRGMVHLRSWLSFPERFEVVGICDICEPLLRKVGDEYGIKACFTDAEEALATLRPEIFSFVTLPDLRIEMVRLAAKYGVKGLVFEKPMATSLQEAKEILEIIHENHIKAVICHQHKYLESFQKVKAAIESGELGNIHRITGETASSFSLNGTHYMDYILWANSGAKILSVAGHVNGRRLLSDDHPSADYFLGEMVFENGVHGNLQCGYMTRAHSVYKVDYDSPEFPVFPEYLEDDRLTVYGSTGYAWAECNGRWAIFSAETEGKILCGKGKGIFFSMDEAQIQYTKDFADWMDDDDFKHPCSVDQAYAGYEAVEAIISSALENRRVDLPYEPPYPDNVAQMRKLLPESPIRFYPVVEDA